MKITKSLLSAMVPATLALALMAGPALAGDKKEPPPKKEVTDCSPGFWKNHTDVWFGVCCDDNPTPQCDDLLTALSARGPGGAAIREAAQRFLNACFILGSPCVDD